VEVQNDSNSLPKPEEHIDKNERNRSSKDINEKETKEDIAILD